MCIHFKDDMIQGFNLACLLQWKLIKEQAVLESNREMLEYKMSAKRSSKCQKTPQATFQKENTSCPWMHRIPKLYFYPSCFP